MIIPIWVYALYVLLGLVLNHVLFVKLTGDKDLNFSNTIVSFTMFTLFLLLLLIWGFNVDIIINH